MPDAISTSTARLNCLCGAINEPGALLSSASGSFPVPSELCHCDSCRQLTGNLCASSPPLRSKPSDRVFSCLTSYNPKGQLVRYFCSTCGCHCFRNVVDTETGTDQWRVCAGLIERDHKQVRLDEAWVSDICATTQHHHVADTVDGGLVPRLLSIGGNSIPMYLHGGNHEQPISPKEVLSLQHNLSSRSPSPSSRLRAECHCGAISLCITRATWEEDTQAVPDRHIPRDKSKYLARICACRSDRLSSGPFAFQPWCYIPPANVVFIESELSVSLLFADAYNLSPGQREAISKEKAKMTFFASSKNARRVFCNTCGASLFYWHGGRQELINVSVGILRAEEGALARNWLEWTWNVVCKEETTERALLEGLLGETG